MSFRHGDILHFDSLIKKGTKSIHMSRQPTLHSSVISFSSETSFLCIWMEWNRMLLTAISLSMELLT